MALQQTVSKTAPGYRVSQPFGAPSPGVVNLEPPMWADSVKAYWTPFSGSRFFPHFHPGIDRAADAGSRVHAMEAGEVIRAGWANDTDGIRVDVQIRPGTIYYVNHLMKEVVFVGQKVSKGDTLGFVGMTGKATGPHVHEGLSIEIELFPGNAWSKRPVLFDTSLYLPGGSRANSDAIKPLERYFRVAGPGVNIRYAPPEFESSADILAVSRSDGLHRIATGNRIAPLDKRFTFIRFVDTHAGPFAIGNELQGHRIAVHKSLIRWA